MKLIVISTLYLLILIALEKFVFVPSYLYYELPWLDIPMHLLGGFGVASLTGAILAYNRSPVSYWKLFVAYAVISVAWETYEYAHDVVRSLEWNGWPDTMSDLINGWIGMSIAYFFVRK